MQFTLSAFWCKEWFSSRKALLNGHLSAETERRAKIVWFLLSSLSRSHLFVLALSQEFVENAVRLLVTRFMPLNPGDLEKWMNDPEEWVNLEDRDSDLWEFELRVCFLLVALSTL